MSGSPPPALDFSSGTPVAIFTNSMVISWEGCGTMSDANGNLLFYADGTSRLYLSNHTQAPNGGGLYMGNSITQGPIFVPKPGNPNIYYMFHIGMPTVGPPPPWNLYYSEIDITLNGGLGNINANKNVSIASSFGSCSEKMSITKDCSGTGYWLLVHSYTGNTFRAYPITTAGIGAPVVSSVGTAHVSSGSGDDAIGQMKISPNGTKVALVVNLSGFAEAYDFNKSTGVVSNPIALGSAGPNPYGLEFSPDNSKIYTSNSATPAFIKQWDLCAGSPAAIIASGTSIANSNVYGMQMAADGKIYGSRFTSTMCVINNPNVAGIGCNFVANGVSVAPRSNSLGLPGFITNYFETIANTPKATSSQVNSGSCACTGSATVDICTVFGSSPYTYAWSNGTTTGPTTNLTSTINNLCPGTYSVIVKDATCKADTLTYIILGSGNSFTVTPNTTSASCGSANGTATVSVNGGTAPYTYSWNPTSQTGATATGLAAGNYTVTIIDAAACTQTTVVTIASAGGGTVSITSQNISCSGGSNGAATASLGSGILPYTYSWSNGQSTSAATGLSSGTYTCIVTDATGCSSTETVSITQPTAITSSVSTTQSSCGLSTGTATMNASGGTSPFTYSWNNGQTSQVATALAGGNYTCTVTDANGCTQSNTANITNANGPTVNISSQTQPSCNGGSNASATAAGSAGTAPYTYGWSNGQNAATATGLSAGTYTIIITDASGCTNLQTVTISQPTPIVASATNTIAGCNLSNGTATASASGGSTPYTYAWNNGQATPTATGLASGTYACTITDANGCTQITTTTILSGNGPTANAGSSVTIQAGSSTQLNASGGVTYAWSPSAGLNNSNISNPIATPTLTTTYCVLVSDVGGCLDSTCVTVYLELPCGNFYIPNAFSPNGDNENDVFKAYINPVCVLEYKLVIYNRWGEKVFETTDIKEGWNGVVNGAESNSAVYTFYCFAKLSNGIEIKKEGNVSLVR